MHPRALFGIVALCAAAAATQADVWWRTSGDAGFGTRGEVQSPVVDAMGDAIDFFGAGEPLTDLDTIDVTYSATDLHFSLTFHTPIAPPSAGLPESLFGAIQFDVDHDPTTGDAPLQNFFSPPFTSVSLGADYELLFDEDPAMPGFSPLINNTDETFVMIPLTYTANSVSGVIPLSALADDGLLNFTTMIGTLPQPTDAMDVVGVSVAIPAPAAGLILPGLYALTRRRTRA